MVNKSYITAEQLLDDAFKLGAKIIESGYRPDCIVGVWRGGTPVAIAVHELMNYCGVMADHIAIRTSYYTGINQRAASVTVHGLDYIVNNIDSNQSILLVDDVFDTGLSLHKVILELNKIYKGNPPEIKLATPYFKPTNNKTNIIPDYYLHKTDAWLVFPHELQGLSIDEILTKKPGIASIKHLFK